MFKERKDIIWTIVILVFYTCFVLLIFIPPIPPPPPPPNRSPELSIKEVRGAVKNGDRYLVRKKQELEISLSATDEDGDKLSFYVENKPATADFSDKVFQWKPAKASDSTTVTFVVTDGKGGVDSEKITIDVINQPPKFNPLDDKSVKVGQSLSFVVSAKDPDGDTLTYSFSSKPLDIKPLGATIDPKTGSFSWQPNEEHIGEYEVTFTVDDGDGGTDSQDITITVEDNQPPPEPKDSKIRVHIYCTPNAKILLDGKVIKENWSTGYVDLEVGDHTIEFQLQGILSPQPKKIHISEKLKGITVDALGIKEY